jgi:V/A-type H+/Na+-transporting ATPase subunit A
MTTNDVTEPVDLRLVSADPEPRLVRVAGPVVQAIGLDHSRLFDVVRVGPERLPGEVIRLDREVATIQVFEDTTGLAVGDPVEPTGAPLMAELGPGLLGSIIDGTGRPLAALAGLVDGRVDRPFIPRGAYPARLDVDRLWEIDLKVGMGAVVGPGDLVATVPETQALEHRILVPPGRSGRITAVYAGPLTVRDPVVEVDHQPIALAQQWPVRQARPASNRLPLDQPLLTGTRVLDLLFPIARGGAAIIPGGFGTGKTMTEQSLAKFSEADIVVYIGCGERGNELTEVLHDFPRLLDPRTGAPLMERTVLIANTSNMPVAAREASIYVGVTVAEYFRDQGYHVALMADSTSRWGEALREVSTRLDEIPAEDGYPAYLASRLAGFYERSGHVECLGSPSRTGSVTVVGAVSPAGGDFSEPITQNSLRLTGAFWALDTALARSRHYPAVNWTRSFSQYAVGDWFDRTVSADWSEIRTWALALLQQESGLQDMAALLGVEALAPNQRLVLATGRLLREHVLQQSVFDDRDASCPPIKAIAMLRTCRRAHAAMTEALDRGASVERVVTNDVLGRLAEMKRWTESETPGGEAELTAAIHQAMEAI